MLKKDNYNYQVTSLSLKYSYVSEFDIGVQSCLLNFLSSGYFKLIYSISPMSTIGPYRIKKVPVPLRSAGVQF